MTNINTYIIDSFQLFAGLRSKSEDQAILDRVVSLCLEEVAVYLESNLTPDKKDEIESKLDQHQDLNALMLDVRSSLADPYEADFDLEHRLRAFISQLVVDSCQK